MQTMEKNEKRSGGYVQNYVYKTGSGKTKMVKIYKKGECAQMKSG